MEPRNIIKTLILAHGSVETSCDAPYINSLQRSVTAGYGSGQRRDIIDMVENTVKVLEDDPLFNAGYGSVLNRIGKAEMDASIMDGKTGRCGAVGAIQNVKNPVSVAKTIMLKTEHVLLVGSGALRFARQMGFNRFDPVTETQKASWKKALALEKSGVTENISAFTGLPMACDTVGCVALHNGETAAASSTGGTFLKLPGRIGDSPVIGGGIFASPHGAAVCTGRGEAFIRIAGAVQAVNLLARGVSPLDAGREIIDMVSRQNAVGGILIVNTKGEFAAVHNSAQFPVALMVDGKVAKNFIPVKI